VPPRRRAPGGGRGSLRAALVLLEDGNQVLHTSRERVSR
jgi:hypothetical protein